MAERKHVNHPTEALAAAAQWHARLAADTGPRTRAAFEHWRAADAANGAAYDRMAARHEDVRILADMPEIQSLRRQTMARMVKQRSQAQRRRRTALAALVLLPGLSLAAWFGFDQYPQQTEQNTAEVFQTAVGQRLTVTLADGSQATLNTASRMIVAYGPKERRLLLEAGQAWFDVEQDQSRPFVVVAGTERIVAHGTQFDVRLRPGQVQVMLAEGAVSVSPDRPRPERTTVRLSPRQLLTVSRTGTSLRSVSEAEAQASWRKGVVLFEDQPLAQVVAEMNRYSRVQLKVADTSTGAIRISGAFRTGDQRAFTEALDLAFGIRAHRTASGRIELARRGSGE